MSIRSKLIDKLIETNGEITRRDLADCFDTTEYQARQARREWEKIPLGPRIAYVDLETTHLIADLGTLLIGSVLSFPEMKMRTFRIDDYKLPIDEYGDRDWTKDGDLAKDIRDCLESHSIVIGWHSKGFDIPFLNTRLVNAGHRKLPTHLHVDPMYYYRGWHGLRPRSSKLAVVAEFYDLEERKMDVDVRVWAKAARGNRKALDELVDRCESDVWITARIADRAFKEGLVKNIQRYG